MGIMKELDRLFKDTDVIFKTNWVEQTQEFSGSVLGIADNIATGNTVQECIHDICCKIDTAELFKNINTDNIDKIILETKIKSLTKELEQAKEQYKRFQK